MRPLGILLFLSTIAPVALGAEMAWVRPDGRVEKLTLPSHGGRARVIVEFTSPPLARMPAAMRTQANNAARETLARFRRDLATRIATEETRERATIHREYVNAFSGAAVTLDADTLDAVRRLPYVRRVTYDMPVRMLAEGPVEPGVAAVRANEVWSALGTRGAGVTVAIIDTGIDYNHSLLGGGIGPAFKVIGGHDFVNNDGDPMDDQGHGTHVAGIVAANSEELVGVAPDAKLVAFKVLGAGGTGSESDVVAALERCLDPNGDGDFSDRVDVANLSLGGPGNPEDAQSTALDNASAAGIVFVAGAGNAGRTLTIISPSTARSAISVGAIDAATGEMADFSSRGPAAVHYSIKPDVVAPGVAVRSAKLGGGTVAFDGTSMATPHVAGVAALLRALHPGWSVAQIKAAIVSTAQGPDHGVMSSGSGRVDAMRAATTTTDVQPPSLSFAVMDGSTPMSTQQLTLKLTNRGTAPRTYDLAVNGQRDGLGVAADAASFTLAAGESRDVLVTATVDHAKLPFPEDLAFGGLLTISAGGESLRVPWSVAKGVRLRLDYSHSDLGTLFVGGTNVVPFTIRTVGENTYETLVKPGTYDIAFLAMPPPDSSRATVLAFYENQTVTTARMFNLRELEGAPFVSTFTPVDETNVPFAADDHCGSMIGVDLPGTIGSMQLLWTDHATSRLRTNALRSGISVVASSTCVSPDLSTLYNAQFKRDGVSESFDAIAGGGDYLRRKAELHFPLPADGARTLRLGTRAFTNGNAEGLGLELEGPFGPRVWRGTLFLMPELSGKTSFRTDVLAASANAYTITPALRVLDGEVVVPYRGELLAFGTGAVMPRMDWNSSGPQLTLYSFVRGQLEDLRSPATPFHARLFDSTGALLGEGAITIRVETMDYQKLTYVAEGTTHEIAGRAGTTSLTAVFGGPQADHRAPTLTSMLLLDANGKRFADRIPRDTGARLVFSANEGTAEVRYRRSGGEWVALPVTVQGASLEAALPPLANGFYDLELKLADGSGNTTTAVSTPAFAVVEGQRTRVARH